MTGLEELAVLIALAEDAATRPPATPHTIMEHLALTGESQAIIDSKGPGVLLEASLRFTGDINIRLDVDGRVIEGGYTTYEAFSEMTSSIDAFPTDNGYVVRLAGIKYRDRLALIVSGTGSIHVFARYEETIK